jgi:4-hydroxybenzoate polyprenyltransferase
MTMRTSGMQRLALRAPWLRHLSCLRLDEVLVLQGPPLLGAAFALRPPVGEHAASIAILTLANACLVAHVFVVNDWSNERADLADPNKRSRVFTANVVDRTEMAALALGLLAASLWLFGILGSTALGLALGIAAFSTLYSAPRFDWKGKPFLNSVAHLAGGTLHFLLGYSLGGRIDSRGVFIASFFALIFAAGHLTQEVRDHQGDVLNAIRTNAVIFGPRPTFAASLVLFALAHAVLLGLALQGAVPRALAVLVALYAIHVRWSLEALADGLTFASICRLQTRYRVLYAAVGVAMLAALWLP